MEKSIKVSGKTETVWPEYCYKEDVLDMRDIGARYKNVFNVDNSVICYVTSHDVFVTPYTKIAEATLRHAGFIEKKFEVPFTHGELPKGKEEEWKYLCDLAFESSYRTFEDDCIDWSEEHGIGKLTMETLGRCLEIPRDGVAVRLLEYSRTYYPVCKEIIIDSSTINNLGSWCDKDGRVIFVYRNGHTYVTYGNWIVDRLTEAGYKKNGRYLVPFSDGEKIVDPELAAKWKEIIPQ